MLNTIVSETKKRCSHRGRSPVMGNGPLWPAGQGLLQNHLHRFPVFFQMERDKVVDESLQRDLPVSRGSRQNGQFPVQGGGNMQRPALHARNAMQVLLSVDGRLHGAVFPCGSHNVVTGRSMSLPGTGWRFPHDLTDALRVHPAGTGPAFYVLSCHDMPS